MHSVVTPHMLPGLPGIIFPLRLRHWHLLAVTLPEALFNPGVWRCHHLPSRCTWCNPWGLRSSARSPSPRAARWSWRAADAQTPALAGGMRKHAMMISPRCRLKMHNVSCAHYLSGRVEQRLCKSGAPVIVHIWVPQGSRVHFSRLCKRLFISASHQIRHCGDANNTGDAKNKGWKRAAVCLLTDYIATQRTLVLYTATHTQTHPHVSYSSG